MSTLRDEWKWSSTGDTSANCQTSYRSALRWHLCWVDILRRSNSTSKNLLDRRHFFSLTVEWAKVLRADFTFPWRKGQFDKLVCVCESLHKLKDIKKTWWFMWRSTFDLILLSVRLQDSVLNISTSFSTLNLLQPKANICTIFSR